MQQNPLEHVSSAPVELETEESLNVDSEGNIRALRTMRDGSIQKLSDAEFAVENAAIGENTGERAQS